MIVEHFDVQVVPENALGSDCLETGEYYLEDRREEHCGPDNEPSRGEKQAPGGEWGLQPPPLPGPPPPRAGERKWQYFGYIRRATAAPRRSEPVTEPVIDNVKAPGGGRIGLVHCPGTHAAGMVPAGAAMALDADIAVLAQWRARALVTLLQPFELTLLGVEDLGARTQAQGLAWWHLPVTDGAAPGETFERAWRADVGPALHAQLDAGERLVVHCRAGIGRSGSVAARLLIERGMDPEQAIVAVRRARPGAIESPEQAMWVRACGAR